MKDNDIIKALEYCFTNEDCSLCPLFCKCPTSFELQKFALDLINRQKAEIEKLKERDETAEKIIREQADAVLSLQDEVSRLNDMLEHRLDESNNKTIEIVKLHHEIQVAKNKAIIEFAERLKKELNNIARVNIDDYDYFCIGLGFIDNLVKEMVVEGG